MNKVYKLVWNATLKAWVVVSELAKGRKKSSKTLVIASITALSITTGLDTFAGYIDGGATTAVGAESIAIGQNAEALTNKATAIGKDATATGEDAIALGTNAIALDEWTGSPNPKSGGAIAIGLDSYARAGSGIALGVSAKSHDYAAVAIGDNANARANGAVALGVNSRATSGGSMALGNSSSALGAGSVSIGIQSSAKTTGSVSIGQKAESSFFATAIGMQAIASGIQSVAIGTSANASSISTLAIGVTSKASASNSLAIGTSANATVVNSVALGDSTTTTAQSGNAVITGTAATTQGVVSVGSATTKRRIQNVADGADLQDAVTVAQLVKAQENLQEIIGGESTLENGVVLPKDIGGIEGANTVDDAIKGVINKGLVFTGNSGNDYTAKLGTTVAVKGADDNKEFTESDAGKNIYTQVEDNGIIRVALAKDLVDLTSITVKNGVDGKEGTTVIGKDGISVTGPQGAAGEPGKTTTIEGGTIVTEAIHLAGKDGKDGVDLTADLVDGVVEYDRNADGSIDKDSVTLVGTPTTSVKNSDTGVITTTGGTVINNVASAGDYTDVANAGKAVNAGDLNNAVQDVTNKGLVFAGNSGNDYTAKLGTTVAVKGADDNKEFTESDAGKNIYTQVEDNGTIRVGMAQNLDLGMTGSITFGDTKVNNLGLTIKNGPSITSTGIDMGNHQIKNVASAGDIFDIKNAQNAVNVDDLLEALGNFNVDLDSRFSDIGPTFAGDDETISDPVNPGDVFSIVGYTKEDIFTGEKHQNIKTSIEGQELVIQLQDELKFDYGSISYGNTSLSNDGLIINTKFDADNNPVESISVTEQGINAGNTVITNVAASDNDTDAANVAQVKAAKTEIVAGKNTTVTSEKGVDGQTVYTVDANSTSVKAGSDALVVKVGDQDDELNTEYTIDLSQSLKDDIAKGVEASAGVKELNDYAVQYDKNKDGTPNKNSITLVGDKTTSTKDPETGLITTVGGTTINNLASAGDYTDVANAGKAVNAGDLNNAVQDVTNKGLVFAGNSGSDYTAKLGTTVAVKGAEENKDFSQSDAGKNIYTQVENDGTIRVALAKDVDLGVDGSIKAGDTIINNNGVTINKDGNVTIGKTIIQEGSIIGLDNTKWDPNNIQEDRAATEGQIADVVNNITNQIGTLAESAVQYDKNSDGSVNKDSITLAGDKTTSTKDPETGLITTVGGTTINNLASAGDYTDVANAGKAVNAGDLNNAVQDVTNKGLVFAGNSGSDYTAKLGTTVAVKGAEENKDFSQSDAGKNIYTQVENDGTIRVALAKDVDLGANGSITTGNTKINNDGLTIKDGPSLTSNGINAGDKAITNVAAGTNKTDAINVSQMQELNAKILKYLGSSEIYADERADGPMYHVDGKAHESVGSAIDALDRADQALNTKVDNLSQNLEQAFYNTNQKIDAVEKKANAGIAAAMALESAPYIPGKFTYAVGASYHGGENAVGVTLRRTADNGRWSITGGVAAASQGDPSFRIGISGVIN